MVAKMNWLAIPCALLIALCLLGVNELKLSDTVWWSCLLPALLLLALWKYRVRIWCSRRWQTNMSQEQINSAEPIGYWWLGMYFFLVGGLLPAMILSQYFDFRIPVAVYLAFFSLWWIKMEILWLLLCHNGVRSEVPLNG